MWSGAVGRMQDSHLASSAPLLRAPTIPLWIFLCTSRTFDLHIQVGRSVSACSTRSAHTKLPVGRWELCQQCRKAQTTSISAVTMQLIRVRYTLHPTSTTKYPSAHRPDVVRELVQVLLQILELRQRRVVIHLQTFASETAQQTGHSLTSANVTRSKNRSLAHRGQRHSLNSTSRTGCTVMNRWSGAMIAQWLELIAMMPKTHIRESGSCEHIRTTREAHVCSACASCVLCVCYMCAQCALYVRFMCSMYAL
jgi:hypothetical protein